MVPVHSDVLSGSGSQGFTWNAWHNYTVRISFQAPMAQDTRYLRLLLDESHPMQHFNIVGPRTLVFHVEILNIKCK